MIIGALARFQKRYAMQICGLIYLSNHCHLLLRPHSVEQLASFMRDVNSKIAREVGRLHRWREKIWGRRDTTSSPATSPKPRSLGCAICSSKGARKARRLTATLDRRELY
jgi:hypothetical protein